MKKINGKSIIFIFLTTDLYLLKDVVEYGETHKDYMKSLENIKCIQNIESPDSKMNTVNYIKQLTKKQNNLISKTLGNIFKSHSCYIFVGHEPLVSAKVKKGEDNLTDIEELLQLFNKSAYRNKKIIYLCADTHLYQSGIITLSKGVEIQQEIVGTGGAKLDNCPENNDSFNREGFYNYKVAICKKNYGFGTLEINLDRNNNLTATSNFHESTDLQEDSNL